MTSIDLGTITIEVELESWRPADRPYGIRDTMGNNYHDAWYATYEEAEAAVRRAEAAQARENQGLTAMPMVDDPYAGRVLDPTKYSVFAGRVTKLAEDRWNVTDSDRRQVGQGIYPSLGEATAAVHEHRDRMLASAYTGEHQPGVAKVVVPVVDDPYPTLRTPRVESR